ncbi:MAG: flagellar brake protein [Planctomycetota bacterium]|jgi:hypothetical protein
MNEIRLVQGSGLKQILWAVRDRKMPVFISYLLDDDWYLVRALVTAVREDSFDIRISPKKRSQLIDIKACQSVGVSFQFGFGQEYDRFVFDAVVIGFKSSSDLNNKQAIILSLPQQIERVLKRSYVRVDVPKSLEVSVQLWNQKLNATDNCGLKSTSTGRLVDISAGGMQVAVDFFEKVDFKAGQSLRLRFSPLPNETPIMFNARIKNISPTADGHNRCLGLEMVGLEASPEGRLILQRLCNVVEQYQQMNQANIECNPT